jgi:sugar phosphate isomerase/epimerase
MATNELPNGIKLGVSLFSFTYEYHQRKYSFEGLLREVKRRNLGLVEVIGPQSFREFPDVSDKAAAEFNALMDEIGLERSALDINADVLIDRKKPMTLEESVEYHARQIRSAAKLGYKLVRYQYGAGTEAIRQLVPLIEKLDVTLGLELHAPHHVNHPDVIAFREMYDKAGSPRLGFIPDFGTNTSSIPRVYIDYFKWRQIPETLVAQALSIWTEEIEPFAKREKFLGWARDNGYNEITAVEVTPIFNLFYNGDPRGWLELMPQIVHVHAKFFEVGDNNRDAAIRYENILPVFVEGGYSGTLSSEYEAHHVSDPDAFAQVEKQQAMMREILLAAAR